MKIRLWGLEEECRAAAQALMRTDGLIVLSVDGPKADRGASVLVRFYIEARLGGPPPAAGVTSTQTRPARSRRRALPPAANSPGGSW